MMTFALFAFGVWTFFKTLAAVDRCGNVAVSGWSPSATCASRLTAFAAQMDATAQLAVTLGCYDAHDWLLAHPPRRA